MSLQQKHLLGLEGYPAEDIQTIIDTAFTFREVLERPIKKVPSLPLPSINLEKTGK